MAEDFWENDDLEYSGDFVADLDEIVEQHRSKLQVNDLLSTCSIPTFINFNFNCDLHKLSLCMSHVALRVIAQHQSS